MTQADTILQLINSNGPILPVHAAKAIGSNILMASAHLSELVSRKKVKVSKIKVGGSPLYYLPGQEPKLENFSDNLNLKEKEAFELLRLKKVLRDNAIEAAYRVALRQLKDFAFPLEVRYNDTKELFWKWHSTTPEETNDLIRQIITPPKPTPELKREPPKVKPKQEVQQKIPVEKVERPKKPKIESKEIENEVKQETKPKVEKDVTSPLIKQLEKYFSKNNIQTIERNIIRKGSEIEFVINVPSSVGSLTYFCKAKSKKRINDGDLSSAFIQGQTKKLPVLFLTKGTLTKKAQEMLENEFKGMTLAQL
ncbi:hypothetical protein KY361_01370 [Candidatus Woesearchaeota archaeon]|nr:hypothetical protein [Candidatus Woesearchaeota archaeon]